MILPFMTAQAAVIEKNVAESKIYYAVTPDLNLTIMDLGSDGGLLTLSLDYVGSKAEREIKDLQTQNPGFTVETVMVEPTESKTQLQIAEIKYSQDVEVKQGQVGPYINSQIVLTAEQMKSIKSLKTDLSEAVQISFKVRTSVSWS